MKTPLAMQIVSAQILEHRCEREAALENPEITDADLKAMTNRHQRETWELMQQVDRMVDELERRVTLDAISLGAEMVNDARGQVEPEYFRDLEDGMKVLVGRAIATVRNGGPSDVGLMDSYSRKLLFLLQSSIQGSEPQPEQ